MWVETVRSSNYSHDSSASYSFSNLHARLVSKWEQTHCIKVFHCSDCSQLYLPLFTNVKDVLTHPRLSVIQVVGGNWTFSHLNQKSKFF